jgi:crotonobetainyl-CoA:carnitine CoA-transferase CaiB-like acyl-CoA transferase
MDRPLEGIRVLEFSTMITAAFAAMMMAEQGAEVIKVEPLEGGDPMRAYGSIKGGFSALFANINRGKRSVCLDLKSDAGRSAAEALVADTDVLLCNFRPGVMDSLGLGSDVLRSLNPRLVFAALSGFGTEGPLRDRPAYDPVIQAQAGFTAVQGERTPEPQFVRNLVCDKITAYTACQAVTAALYQRERTGHGQHIDLSMMDAGLFFLFPDGFMHHTLLDDDVEHRPPLADALYEPMVTADGAITVSAGSPAQQIGMVQALERMDLLADERFSTTEKLIANLGAFREELRRSAAALDTATLVERLEANDVPVARLIDFEEVLTHPQYEANGSLDVFTHPQLGSMRRMLSPARFGGERLPAGRDAPAHGAHTREVLAELGHDDAAIDALIASGAAR